jgi:uncharacterized membrane protein YhhN
MLYCALLTLVSLAAMFAANAKRWSVLGGVFKMIASTGFLGVALCAGGLHGNYGRLILLALCFSWFGDLFLIFRKEALFLLGLIAFFLGHVMFAGAFLAHGVDLRWVLAAGALMLVPLFVVGYRLTPHLGDMRIPVYAYMVVISCMVAFSAGAWGRGGTPLIAMGAVMFYCSDLFVARDRFLTADHWNSTIGLPLYYGAQLLLAYSVCWR